MADSRKYIKPSASTRSVSNWLARFGAPALLIPGRRSGELRATAVIPLTVEGKKYVISTRGDTDWALNLRAAGGGELRRGWGRKTFKAVEVAGAEQERVVAVYRRRYGVEVNQYFDRLPRLADHPTFRLDF
jgi:deazaflavin-dependent oxidoreductase (nitroreductase family)